MTYRSTKNQTILTDKAGIAGAAHEADKRDVLSQTLETNQARVAVIESADNPKAAEFQSHLGGGAGGPLIPVQSGTLIHAMVTADRAELGSTLTGIDDG
jgi:hypothetical protein